MKFKTINNKLIITTNNKDKANIKNWQQNGKHYKQIIFDLFEPFFTNNGYFAFYGDEAGHLTEAFMIAEKPPLSNNDVNLNWQDIGETWILEKYMFIDELNELKRGKLELQLI